MPTELGHPLRDPAQPQAAVLVGHSRIKPNTIIDNLKDQAGLRLLQMHGDVLGVGVETVDSEVQSYR